MTRKTHKKTTQKTPPKTQKKTRTKQSRRLDVNIEPGKILRTVSNEESFHFYEAIGKPTREYARSLSDFLEKVKTVKLESLRFHLQRKDFQNWIEKTLRDPELAKRIEKIAPSQNDDIRTKIHSILEKRIKELKEPSLKIMVDTELALTSKALHP